MKKITRGRRFYNGSPSKFMNMLYDGLKGRIENFPRSVQSWSILSLYIARSASVAEREIKKANKNPRILWETIEKTAFELTRVERERNKIKQERNWYSDLYNQRFNQVQKLRQELSKLKAICRRQKIKIGGLEGKIS